MLETAAGDFAWNSAASIAAAVTSGRVSATHIVEATLARIRERDPLLNSFTAVTERRALARAQAIDAARAKGEKLPPLAGVPFAVKNLFDVAGLPTLAGSKINRDLPPATHDATLIERLEAAGAILVGALNMGEYAYDFTGENVARRPFAQSARSRPHDRRFVRRLGRRGRRRPGAARARLRHQRLDPGAGVALRHFRAEADLRAASRARAFPFVASLDHLGPFARSARDLALAYDAMQGFDADDPACADRAAEPVAPHLDSGIGRPAHRRGRRLFPGQGRGGGRGRRSRRRGARRQPRYRNPEAERARAAAFIITASEGASLHLDRLRTRAEDFDPAVRDRLIAGAMMPASLVVKAQKFRRWYRDEVLKLFDEVDAILAPATPCTAPLIGQQTFMLGDVELPVRANLGLYTQPISFIGLPVVAVPVPLAPLPIGVQIIAAPWREDVALRIAHALEAQGVVAAPRPAL